MRVKSFCLRRSEVLARKVRQKPRESCEHPCCSPPLLPRGSPPWARTPVGSATSPAGSSSSCSRRLSAQPALCSGVSQLCCVSPLLTSSSKWGAALRCPKCLCARLRGLAREYHQLLTVGELKRITLHEIITCFTTNDKVFI